MAGFIKGIVQAGVETNIVNFKEDFISKYGETSTDYNQLDQLGNMNNKGIIIGIFVMSVIFSIVAFAFSNSTNKDDGTQAISPGPGLLSNILYYVGWFFVLVAVFTLGYGSYLYFLVYLPQYFDWFKSLPAEAKTELMTITTLNNVNNDMFNNRNNNNNDFGIRIGRR